MPPRRRVPVADGRHALQVCRAAASPSEVSRETLATAVRYTLEELAARAPGRAVEVRVPPYGAVQCVAGTVHRRGTPPSVIEAQPWVWLGVCTGAQTWEEALGGVGIVASGERADLGRWLPL